MLQIAPVLPHQSFIPVFCPSPVLHQYQKLTSCLGGKTRVAIRLASTNSTILFSLLLAQSAMDSPTIAATSMSPQPCELYLRDVLTLLTRVEIDAKYRLVSRRLDSIVGRCPESKLPRRRLFYLLYVSVEVSVNDETKEIYEEGPGLVKIALPTGCCSELEVGGDIVLPSPCLVRQ